MTMHDLTAARPVFNLPALLGRFAGAFAIRRVVEDPEDARSRRALVQEMIAQRKCLQR